MTIFYIIPTQSMQLLLCCILQIVFSLFYIQYNSLYYLLYAFVSLWLLKSFCHVYGSEQLGVPQLDNRTRTPESFLYISGSLQLLHLCQFYKTAKTNYDHMHNTTDHKNMLILYQPENQQYHHSHQSNLHKQCRPSAPYKMCQPSATHIQQWQKSVVVEAQFSTT